METNKKIIIKSMPFKRVYELTTNAFQSGDYDEEKDIACAIAQFCISKQIAEGPITDEKEDHICYKCPDCNSEIKYNQSHCDICGKCIEWEGKENG